MQLMQVPKEIHLSIIESILESVDSVNVLKPLAFTCRHFAYLCLSEIWKTRMLTENNSLNTFRNTLSKNPLIPYGDFILKILVYELNKKPPIYIDDKLINFFAEKCKNLKELNVFTSFGVELLGDRINHLTIVNYENWDIFAGYFRTTICNIPSTRKGSDKLQERTKGGLNDSNRNDEAEYHDALSETVKLGVVKSVQLHNPKMSERVWESFTSNADSLQSISITFNQTILTTDPSMIVMLVGKNCKNLRIFDIDTFQQAISKDSTMILLENCKKLDQLEGPSWRVITIDDGSKINPEFFETLEQAHHNLEFLGIKGFKYNNLLNDDSFDKSKFKEAWWYYKNTCYKPIIYWPTNYVKKKEKYPDGYSLRLNN
ncbi:20110_t:CDS:2 [Funneliformis geosporum]|uniref:14374_t:CDS:1 n=1 Tax=Funneliformis geosporum TaxID=1117311 RepID=A0A9W4SMZ7_9GLOM|nr:20110_t:CDS:2 [Funneliformis geosporum]CAI2172907.1 14374_t:CDS:2 [Funneliformis geosporum]